MQIIDVDELLDGLAAVLETPDEPDEVERVLDGLARLCAVDVGDLAERRAPLRKRAQSILAGRGSSDGAHVRSELARLALAWCDGEFTARKSEDGLRGFLAARLDGIGERVARREARSLLSTPTHRGGFIASEVLVRRVRELSAGNVLDVADAALSLLRLSSDGRCPASAVKVKGELEDALRHALGAKGVRVGATVPLWIAAARARSPGEDDAAVARGHPDLGPGAGEAGRFEPEFFERSWSWAERGKTKTAWHRWITVKKSPAPPETVPPLHLSVSLHPARVGGKGTWEERMVEELAELRWAFTQWPAWKEPLFAEGAIRIAWNLDWSEAAWSDRGFLEPLVDPTTPLGPMARLLLGLGLGAKEPGQHGLAIDAAIAALEDGRLEATQFGESVAPLLEKRVVLPARWAKTFAEVARASPAHADAVATTLQRALRGPSPRDVGALLDLVHELLVEQGRAVDDPGAVEWLRQVEGGKAAKSAKALLALGTAP